MKNSKFIKKVVAMATTLTLLFSISTCAFAAESEAPIVTTDSYSQDVSQHFDLGGIYVGNMWGQDVYATLSGTLNMTYQYEEGSWSYINNGASLDDLSIDYATAEVRDYDHMGACIDFHVEIYNNGNYVETVTVRVSVDNYGEVYILLI